MDLLLNVGVKKDPIVPVPCFHVSSYSCRFTSTKYDYNWKISADIPYITDKMIL